MGTQDLFAWLYYGTHPFCPVDIERDAKICPAVSRAKKFTVYTEFTLLSLASRSLTAGVIRGGGVDTWTSRSELNWNLYMPEFDADLKTPSSSWGLRTAVTERLTSRWQSDLTLLVWFPACSSPSRGVRERACQLHDTLRSKTQRRRISRAAMLCDWRRFDSIAWKRHMPRWQKWYLPKTRCWRVLSRNCATQPYYGSIRRKSWRTSNQPQSCDIYGGTHEFPPLRTKAMC